MPIKVQIEGVQTKLDEKTKEARRKSRKAALAALGLVGLTYDAGKSVLHSADDFVDRAEKRGEEIEAILNTRVSEVQEQMTEEAKARREQVEQALGSVSDSMGSTGKTIEEKVKSGLSSLKVDSGTVLETDQIKIEVEVVDSEEPWEGYDSLNAQEIINRLSELDDAQLKAVLDYEARTKKRVTILREIEMHLAGFEDQGPATPAQGDETATA